MGAPRDVGLLLNCASPRSPDPVGEGELCFFSHLFGQCIKFCVASGTVSGQDPAILRRCVSEQGV